VNFLEQYRLEGPSSALSSSGEDDIAAKEKADVTQMDFAAESKQIQ
jgi:hypothetical protein